MTTWTEIYKEFTFEAAHKLTRVPSVHKCARMHGHSFKVIVHVAGERTHQGWVQDFADLKAAWKPLEKILDHNCLNDVEGLMNPTSEILAMWIGTRLSLSLPLLTHVEVKETCNTGAIWRVRKPSGEVCPGCGGLQCPTTGCIYGKQAGA